MNELGASMKEINIQDVKKTKDTPMIKDSLIGFDLSDSDIDAAAQTWSNVEDNPLVHNSVVDAVIDGMDKQEEYY